MKKPNLLQHFFIICSGAEHDILHQCPTEWNKYAGIGATIFLTACLAFFSGGYSIQLIFQNVLISALLGAFWAIIIFNLDRYIVLSLRKEQIPTSKDILRETEPAKKEELIQERKRMIRRQVYIATPRFVIALIIALTVSKPIELRLFENRIEKQLASSLKEEGSKFDSVEAANIRQLTNQLSTTNQQEQHEKDALFEKDPVYTNTKDQIPKIQSDIQKIETKINANYLAIRNNEHLETRSRQPVNPITHQPQEPTYTIWVANNSIPENKRKENTQLTTEKARLSQQYATTLRQKTRQDSILSQQSAGITDKYETSKKNVDALIKNAGDSRQQRRDYWMTANQKSTDLPSKLEALGNISHFGNSIWWASLVITLLFITLETAPVLVKLLTKRGPYDEILDTVEHEHYLNQQETISRWHAKVNELLARAHDAAALEGKMFLTVETQRINQELENNKNILVDISQKQEYLAKIAIEKWYQNELIKIKTGDPEPTSTSQTTPPPQAPPPSQTSQPQPKLEEIFWRQKGSPNKIEYYFRNSSSNEFLYIENDQLNKGTWAFKDSQLEIIIDIINSKKYYYIITLDLTTLTLQETDTLEIFDFEKA